MTILAIARREWIGRRNLFLLALGMGLIQLVALWTDAQGPHLSEQSSFMSTLTGTGLAFSVAALFGASMVGRDLDERRFGFFLNHPLAPWDIYAGKVLGGLGLALLAGIVVVAPSALLARLWRLLSLRDVGQVLGFWLIGCFVLLLFFHAASIQVRSRSPWLLLDLAAWVGFAWGVRRLTGSLLTEAAFPALGHLWLGQLGLVTAGLAVAGYLQVAQGRGDLRRGHRWISLTLTTTLALSLLVGWLQVSWVRAHPAPDTKAHPARVQVR